MKLRVINAVKYDPTQMHLLQARWSVVNTLDGVIETEEIVDVQDIVHAVKAGEKVTTSFFVNQNTLNGPLVQVAMYGHGNESIVIPEAENYQDKRIRNLPHLSA